jgi:predicted nucleotidyltransferase component of viral defense system
VTSGRNIPASVRQKLLNLARNDKRPFGELLQYYVMERFLYRLSKSVYTDHFILKGALMLRAWDSPEFRPTMDIDMLVRSSNEEANIKAQILEIMKLEVQTDGISFDPGSIRTEPITENAGYVGIRVRFIGSLGSARVSVQIDIGFGDVIFPQPELVELPTLLEYPAPRLFGYSRESTIAEKFEAMVKLGLLNSRMKDFYDIWLLSRQFNFDGAILAESIRLTFKQRGTELITEIDAFSESFIDQKQSYWISFYKRLNQDHVPASFREVVKEVESFLAPIVSSILKETKTNVTWKPAGSWI